MWQPSVIAVPAVEVPSTAKWMVLASADGKFTEKVNVPAVPSVVLPALTVNVEAFTSVIVAVAVPPARATYH